MELNNLISNIIHNDSNINFIEIFGYQISLEDLLLIGLIFCLYKEGVEDQLLFISLILLLFSWFILILFYHLL